MKSLGNSSNTFVWSEKWIMDDVPRRPVNKQTLSNVMLKVSEIIYGDGKWRADLLMELFPENEVKRISAIPIGNMADRFVWAYTKHGSYTVKRGYSLMENLSAQREATRSPQEKQLITLKKAVWKIATLPKIKMFLWRALSGAIAVTDRLNSRGLNLNPMCQVCKQDRETINHLLFHCSSAEEIWNISGFPMPALGFSQSLEDNFQFVFNLLSNQSNTNAATRALPWPFGIYGRRETPCFTPILKSLEHSWYKTRRRLKEAALWFVANDKGQEMEQQNEEMNKRERWAPLETGLIKFNMHAN